MNPTELQNANEFLRCLHFGGDWFEIRALLPEGRRFVYHRDIPEALEHVAELDAMPGAGVYVTINPARPECAERAYEFIKVAGSGSCTSKGDVIRRNWLPVDIDPVRPSGTSATDGERQEAVVVAGNIKAYLGVQGWPVPLECLSPNGVHLLYPVALDNDAESEALVKNALQFLHGEFSTDSAKVDVSLSDANRILRIPGTEGRKGTPTDERPHRRGSVVAIPASQSPRPALTTEQLRELLPAKAPESPVEALKAGGAAVGMVADILARLERCGVRVERVVKRGEDGTWLHLERCPVTGAAGGTSVSVQVTPSGRVLYHNLHDRGTGVTWEDVELWLGQHEPWGPLSEALSDDEVPFPLDAIPQVLRDAVVEVRDFVQAPLPLVVNSALAALAIAAQGQVDVVRAEGLHGPSSLFLLAIADSGERKSSCDGHFTEELRKHEREEHTKARAKTSEQQARVEAWNAKKRKAQRKLKEAVENEEPTDAWERGLKEVQDGEPMPLSSPRLLYSDTTSESIAANLANTWPTGGIIAPEGGLVFGGYALKEDNAMKTLSLLNQLWDGTSGLTVDRRTSESFKVPGGRFSLGIMVQPDVFRQFMMDGGRLARGSGWIARFLVTFPKSTIGHRRFRRQPTWEWKGRFNDRLGEILRLPLPRDADGVLTPNRLSMSEEAQSVWIAFHDKIEQLLGHGEFFAEVKDVGSKTADNAARIAGLFAILEGSSGLVVTISEAQMQMGAKVAEWYLGEACRVLALFSNPIEAQRAELLLSWLKAQNRKTGELLFPIGDVQRRGPNSVRRENIINDAMGELSHANLARFVLAGRRKFIQLNPAAVA